MVPMESSIVLPTEVDPVPPTPLEELDRRVAALKAKSPSWIQVDTKERARLLRECVPLTFDAAHDAAPVEERLKGSYGSGQAEPLLNWGPILNALNAFAKAMDAGGQPALPATRKRSDGQYVVDVWPEGWEALANRGFKGSIWIQPGQEPTQGAVYRAKAAGQPPSPSVSLVLGAGNHVAVVYADILHKLLVDDATVICKMNPVNEAMGPFIERGLAPFIDRGFVSVVYGGADVGRHLCSHPDIASIHLTGSDATYDAIVWQGQPKEGTPPCTKEVSAELGCVTPYIIVPGAWSEHELHYHAGTIAAALVSNSGHNCLKAELIVTDRAWPLREQFLDALRVALDTKPQRVAWYPGSDERFARFRSRFSEGVQELGWGDAAVVRPWLLRTSLDTDTADAEDENWCGVLQEVALGGTDGDAGRFLADAVAYVNDRAWGSLSAGLIIHPATRAEHAEAYDAALAGLRYGAVTVNAPTVLNFIYMPLPWGAFPGNTPANIGSGNCFVHNTKLLDHVQKGIIEAPWVVKPTPFWAVPDKTFRAVAPAALKFFAYPGFRTLMRVVYNLLFS